MRYEARKNWQCPQLQLLVNGVPFGKAYAFDMKLGYYEGWVVDSKTNKVKMVKKNGKYVPVSKRVYAPFTVVWKKTGKPFRPWLNQ